MTYKILYKPRGKAGVKTATVYYTTIGIVVQCPECQYRHRYYKKTPPGHLVCERCGVSFEVPV